MRHLTHLVTAIAAAAAAALAADPEALSSSAVCPMAYSSRRTWFTKDASKTSTIAPETQTVLAYGYSSVGYYVEAWGGGGGSGYPGYGGDSTYGSGGGGAYVGGYFDLTSQPTAVLALVVGGAGGTATNAGASPPCATGCSLPPSQSPGCGAGQGAGPSVVALVAAPTSTTAQVIVIAAAGGNGGERGSGTGGAAVGATAALPDTYCESNFCDFPGTGASPTGPGISGCRQGTPPYSQPCNTNGATNASGLLPWYVPYSSAGGLVVAATGGTCTGACCGNGGGGYFGGGGSFFHSGGGGGTSRIAWNAILVSSTSGSGATAGNGARQFSQLTGAGSGSPDANNHGYPGTAGGIQITECVQFPGSATTTATLSPSSTPSLTPFLTSTPLFPTPTSSITPTSTVSLTISTSPSLTLSQSQTPTPSRTPTASPSASPLLAPSATSVNFAISVPGGSLLSFVTAPSLGVQLRTACASLLGVANSSAFSILNLVSEPAGDTIAGSSVMNARRLQRRGLQPASVIVVTVSVDLTNAAVVSVFGSSPANFATALRLAFADSARVSSAFSAFAAAWAAATSSSPGATVAGLALVAIRLPNSIGAPAPASAASSAASASSVGLYAGAAVAAVVAIVAAVVLGLWIRGQMRLREEARLRMRAASKPSTTTLNPRLRVRAASKPITTMTTFNPSSPQTSIELPAPDLASAQAQPADLEIRLPNSDPASATFSGGRAMSAHTASPERGEDERQDFAPLHALRRDSESGRAMPARAASPEHDSDADQVRRRALSPSGSEYGRFTPGGRNTGSLSWSNLKPDNSGGFVPNDSGAQGIVFRARGRQSLLAVKVLKGFALTGAEAEHIKRELVKEADVLASASDAKAENEYVVKFYGIVEGEATEEWISAMGAYARAVLFRPQGASASQPPSHMIGMVTLWQDGGDIHQRLHARENLPVLAPQERMRLAVEVAAGLAGLHRLDIVHADLKPANVLLSTFSNPHARLADFGLARVTDTVATSGVSRGTFMTARAEKAAGTWPYQAPEMFRLKPRNPVAAKASRSTDVYAFGVLAWELLTGRVPWKNAEGEMPTESEHINELYSESGAALDLDALPEFVPRAVRDCISACLAFRREDRPGMGIVQITLDQAYAEAYTSGKFDVFLSYAWGSDLKRRPFALELYRALSRVGLRVWIDNTPDGAGQMGLDTQEHMKKGITNSSVAVVLLSPSYVASFDGGRPCKFELETILDQRKSFILVMVEAGFWKTWMPADHRVALRSGLAAGRKMYVDLGDVAALPWAMPGEPGGQAEASRAALYDNPDKLPMLLRLVREAIASAQSKAL